MDQLETCTCVCGRAIYWDTGFDGYWAHLHSPLWDEKPHTPEPAEPLRINGIDNTTDRRYR